MAPWRNFELHSDVLKIAFSSGLSFLENAIRMEHLTFFADYLGAEP